MPTPEQRQAALHRLSGSIARLGLRGPSALVLDVLRPLDAISAQCMVFVRPFTNGYSWGTYTSALSDEAGWRELRGMLSDERRAINEEQGDA
ncbi:MAG: hypothetical protein MUD01_05265 [Chloroflexaceae bacterium]|jgi:hypothetical protein|nr:hypothetical protein [Chloroflexaceae bacterium]